MKALGHFVLVELVKAGAAEKVGSLFVPISANQNKSFRTGKVLSLGLKADKYLNEDHYTAFAVPEGDDPIPTERLVVVREGSLIRFHVEAMTDLGDGTATVKDEYVLGVLA